MFEAYENVGLVRAALGPDARAELVRHVLKGKEIAVRYASDLRAVPVPEERQIFWLPENITRAQSMRRLKQLELAFVRVLSVMAIPPTNISMFVPNLSEAFEKADSCKELEAVGTD